MKLYALFVLMLISVGMVSASPVKITNDGEAYGHHGFCEGWNKCGNAEQCALLACQANGFNTLVSYGEGKSCTDFDTCYLFENIDVNLDLDCSWFSEVCEVKGVTDIWCDDGEWTGACNAELPDQSNPPGDNGSGHDSNPDDHDSDPEIPEFGMLAAGAALIGALGIFAFVRRKD